MTNRGNQLKTQSNIRIDGNQLCFKLTRLGTMRLNKMAYGARKANVMTSAIAILSESLGGPSAFSPAVDFLRDEWGMNRNMAIEIAIHLLWDVSTNLDYFMEVPEGMA